MTSFKVFQAIGMKLTSWFTRTRRIEEENAFENPFENMVDTYFYDRIMENKNPLKENFLNDCTVNPFQRNKMMEWFLRRFRLFPQFDDIPEILHLAVGIFDRYIQRHRKIWKGDLDLIALGSLFIAVKMEHGLTTKVAVKDGLFLTDYKYSVDEIMEMERKIFKRLDFKVIIPSSYHFLCRCHLITKPYELEKFACMYLLEIALFSYDTCHIRQSLQASAAYLVIRALSTEAKDVKKLWTGALEYHTGYSLSDVLPVVRKLCVELYKHSIEDLDSLIFCKYSNLKYFGVSRIIANSKPLIKKLMACYCD